VPGVTIPGFFEETGMPDPGWWEALWPAPAKVLSETGMRAGDEVVDLCSGDGWFTLPIAKVAHHVTAIDIDARLIERAKLRLAESDISNCTFIEADVYDLIDVLTRPADYVLLANAFHGVPDRVRLASAVRDVLKPGGLFAVLNWHDRPREETLILGEPRGPASHVRMSPEATIEPIEAAGLVHKFTVEVSPHHYGAVFRRT
jgi:ubiquinone/menaquinone biosynthesis C-methylase UbiE